MPDPYFLLPEAEVLSQRKYFEYFSKMCRHARNISLNNKQLKYLSYFAKHPISSAYDIEPGSKTNQTNYRYAKLILQNLHKLALIKFTKSEKAETKRKHPSKKYSLTDQGAFLLLSHFKSSSTEILQELFRNYHNLDIFQYLVYPFISLESLRSPKFNFRLMAGLCEYIISVIRRMDHVLSSLDKVKRTDKETYFWHYSKIEDFLRNSYHYDFVNFLDSEENDDVDEYHEIRYFDKKNKNNYVIFRFDKKNKRAYIYRKIKRTEKHEIPLSADYVSIKLIPYKVYVARYFHAFCNPKEEEFILSVFPHHKFLPDYDIRDLLSTDRPFKNALRRTKESFDGWYDRITSFSNFSF